MNTITIVVPCYNEEETVKLLINELEKVKSSLQDVNLEVLFINDGSSDNTLAIIKDMAKSYDYLKYISFSRNFGKESAILAGLSNTSGDFVVLIDADMQDPPEMIIQMWNSIKSGEYDCVATRRISRKGEPVLRSFLSRKFYKFINKISNIEIADGARDFRMMNRKVVDAILMLTEKNRFSKGIFGWVGFRTKWLEFENKERIAGKTKWNIISLLKYSIDGITSFSTVPLIIASWLGFILCLISSILIVALVTVVLLNGGDVVEGRPTILCAVMFLGGIQLMCIGILGQYLAKMFIEIKDRPSYIIDEENLNEISYEKPMKNSENS